MNPEPERHRIKHGRSEKLLRSWGMYRWPLWAGRAYEVAAPGFQLKTSMSDMGQHARAIQVHSSFPKNLFRLLLHA